MEQPRSRSARRYAPLLVLLLVSCVQPALAQDFPTSFARLDLGVAQLHDGHVFGLEERVFRDQGTGPWLGIRLGHAFGQRGILALDVGLAGGSSAGGFGTFTGGLELRAAARSRVSPYVRFEAGFMNEDMDSCFVFGIGAGVAVRVGESLALRGGVMGNVHCAAEGAGPTGAFGGVEFRW